MLKIALGQMEIIPGRPDVNTAAMLQMMNAARQQGADMIIFPEMSVPGYLLGDTWEQSAFLRDCEYYVQQLINGTSSGIIAMFGSVAVDWNKRNNDGRVRKYNAFFTAQSGKLLGGENYPYPFRIKTLLPNYREFDDDRHFYSTQKLAVELGIPVAELLRPIQVRTVHGPLSVGCILCEDGWYDDYAVKPAELLAANHPLDLLVNISSSPFTLGKNNKRNRLFSRQARKLGVPVLYVNNVGIQNNGKTVYTFDGCSTVYNRAGAVIAYCPAFTASMPVIDLDTAGGGMSRPAVAVPDDSGIDTVCQAVRYGTVAFLRSIGLERVVIGLSGGIDSSLAAALYAHILPPAQVLLVNMPSQHNSSTTKDLAAILASRLGCPYTVIPIQEAVDLTTRQIHQAELKATGQFQSLTLSPFMLENVQARDRSSRILAALAAAFGGGFTCNANKSELTVGYATLYGDQSGCLAALADLWKHQVYALAQYFNEEVYRDEIIPRGIFTLPPSAELSPDHAVDEGKGDPIIYPYHDYLFRAFVERWDRATPEDLLTWYLAGTLETEIGCQSGLSQRLFPGPAEFITDLERWWKLYTGMAVAKRIQAPPVLAVSRRVFGFDHREAQNGSYFTAKYLELKKQLLG
ncbi:NAD(+) synthase [Acetonema longum]|uniref:Glutamine-dependent NAD(+) synthetase n=1 Tax=Acetonema longum DSM 6540 TaxID=1009370 RepID=F7NIM0_9FIRM|nr:NAD(+) synthase [Acetonema longum]EGO64084.1 NAD+ synthetase [Acetonema longum DSM 6540]